MNPVHYKTLTYKLEFIPFFTTARLLTLLFLKVFPLEKAFDWNSNFSWFVRNKVYFNMHESLQRNLILAIPVVGQIIIIADEILMRVSSSYLIYRSDWRWNNALATLSDPVPARFKNDPTVVRAALRLNLFSTTFETINIGEDLRKNKQFFIELLNNPVTNINNEFDKRAAIMGVTIYQLSCSSKYVEELSSDLRYSLSYIRELGKIVDLMDPSLKKDHELMEKFLDLNPFLFTKIDDELKKDARILQLTERRLREIFNVAYGPSTPETMKWYTPRKGSTVYKVHRSGIAPAEFKKMEETIASQLNRAKRDGADLHALS